MIAGRSSGAIATLLLLVMAALLALTHAASQVWHLPEPATGLVRAGAEAAIVGGLADWFAVVALFRRPLGLPIPHTAVIERSKDRIASGLGQFVERHFLDPALVAERIAQAGLAQALARFLARPENSRHLAQRLARLLMPLLATMDDGEIRALIARTLKGELAAIDLGPLVARALSLIAAGPDNPLLAQAVAALRRLLGTQQEPIRAAVADRSRWWIPRRIDRSIAEAILAGMDEMLAELADPHSPRRAAAAHAFTLLLADLERDPAYGERLRGLAARLLQDPAIAAYLQHLWQALKGSLASGNGTGAAAQQILARALAALAAALAADEFLCRRLDRAAGAAARQLAEPWRRRIGGFIADVVRGWEGRGMAARIEEAIGRDLHYIRINGTLVGALVGCLLYLAQHPFW